MKAPGGLATDLAADGFWLALVESLITRPVFLSMILFSAILCYRIRSGNKDVEFKSFCMIGDSMANIWTNRQRTIDDPTDYRVHPLNLVTIAGSHDYYAIDGVNMALKGSDAWRAYIEKHRALLRKNTSASESAKEELISELSFSAALPVNETSFQALGCGRSRRMRLLLDKEEDTTCEVFPQHRQTHVFTQGYRQHENYLGDAAQKFKHGFGIGEAVYDGTLSDALREFEQAGYHMF